MLEESISSLAGEPPNSVRNFHVRAPLNKYREQHEGLAGQRATATGGQTMAIGRAMHSLERLIEQFKEQRLIDFLSSASWLPGYRQMMTGSLLGNEAGARIPHWAARQAYIALGNLLTCSAVLGVDACPMEGFVPAEFDKVLGLTAQGYAAVVCCALGYRSADDKYAAAPKVRFPVAELVKNI